MYRSIETSFWTDPDARALDHVSRYVFAYLLTNPHSHISGLYYLPISAAREETGLSSVRLARSLDTLSAGFPVRFLACYDASSSVVLVRRMFRHQAGNGKGEKLIVFAGRQLVQFSHSFLADRFAEEYPHVAKEVKYTPSMGRLSRARKTGTEFSSEASENETGAGAVMGRSPHPPSIPLLVPDCLNGLGWGTPLALAALWNELSPPECLNVATLDPARAEKARRYLRMFGDESWWREAFGEVAQSRFLRGLDNDPKGKHRHFRASFDWFLQKGKDGAENCVKAYEGKYRDG